MRLRVPAPDLSPSLSRNPQNVPVSLLAIDRPLLFLTDAVLCGKTPTLRNLHRELFTSQTAALSCYFGRHSIQSRFTPGLIPPSVDGIALSPERLTAPKRRQPVNYDSIVTEDIGYPGGCASNSARISSKRAKTQDLEVSSPLAISAVE
jgi:hypothetical protein